MLWEIEILPTLRDAERDRVCSELELLTHQRLDTPVIARTSRGCLVEGELQKSHAERLRRDLLLDPLVETAHIAALGEPRRVGTAHHAAGTVGGAHPTTVLLK